MSYVESFTKDMMDRIALQQGEMFEYALGQGCDMEHFIWSYMTSVFCDQEIYYKTELGGR